VFFFWEIIDRAKRFSQGCSCKKYFLGGLGHWAYFFGHRPNLFEIAEKKIQSYNIQRYRLVKTVAASFNTAMGQMTEMSQRKKRV